MQKGAAMLVAVIFFLAAGLSIVAGLVSPSIREFKTTNELLQSKQSYFVAESGVEDAYYRLKNALTIGSSTSLTLNNANATTTVTNSGYNEKTISSLGDYSSRQRTSELKLTTTASGIAFNYGLQAGVGGVTINGGSTINGNVYANSKIDAVSATITGTAIAADSVALTTDQSNTSQTSSINFRNVSTSQDFAQSFQISTTAPINKVQFYIKKVGSPADGTVRVVADNAGSPSTTTLPIGTATLTASTVTTSYSWVDVTFSTPTALISGATYWVVIDNSTQNASNYYILGASADTSYSLGTAKTGAYSGSWTATSLDSDFKIFIGGVSSYIGQATYPTGLYVGSAGVGDAWATLVKGSTVAGNLYCTTGTNNNKACNTTHGTPSQVDLPFTVANMQTWKDTAAAGGTITGATKCPGGYASGNCTVNYAGATFGPGKITGNLIVNGGGTLTLTGPIWVVGTVTITGGGKVVLPSSYSSNSETIISDSTISITGGGSAGSGTSGSYLFFVSTSRCPYDTYCAGNNAITISGGAGAIALSAQYGTVALSGSATLASATGNAISVTGGSTVTYNSGLASPSFTSGPTGGWGVYTWKEI